jgi:predicted nuclease of restriction endonuclease-like (RecB) superfamily
VTVKAKATKAKRTKSPKTRRGAAASLVTGSLDFGTLVSAIRQVHERCVSEAGKAVNVAVTLRNWAIGFYIYEYEQHGRDRASYGAKLMSRLAEGLRRAGLERVDARELRRFRQFYLTYPAIREALSPELRGLVDERTRGQPKRETATPESSLDTRQLVTRLSFSQFAELISIEDAFKRTFYEVECMRGNWSVRELKRQIGALYFERSGLSKNPKKLAALVQARAETAEPKLSIRDPYVFEFLGLKSHEVMGESDLEDGLLDKLHTFLIELGHGFCFEARQKRILIGDTYGFIDLVFYHRILKCHVLIELKVTDFNHEHLGQLNTYVSWFKRNAMTKGDNPPIGLLLCTRKDHSLVEYALADLPNRLFVSKYQLELPTREQLKQFLDAQIEQVGGA